jgi:hypothetical protein
MKKTQKSHLMIRSMEKTIKAIERLRIHPNTGAQLRSLKEMRR